MRAAHDGRPVSLAHIDLTLAERANHLAAHHDGIEDAASAYAALSEALFAGGLALLIVVALISRRRHLAAAGVLAGAAAAAALVVGALISAVVSRPRPFVTHADITAFVAHAPDPGFPSDHAVAAFAIATMLALRLGAKALPVLLLAVALAVSRVLVGVHYPGDVLVGALIGAAAALAVDRLARLPWPAAIAS
jgi:undecaprenyl-diphosphatase